MSDKLAIKPLARFACSILLVAGSIPTAFSTPVEYKIEPGHTYPSFEAPHMGISWWRGKFKHTEGKVTLDRQQHTGSVEIVVDTSSVDFGHDKMDEVARGKDFFDVARYPTATYRGTIEFDHDTPILLRGEFTLLGKTQPLQLKINSFKCIRPPMHGEELCGADAEGQFNRNDFGMTRNGEGDLGIVRLRIQVEASR